MPAARDTSYPPTVRGSGRLAVAVQKLDHLDGLEVEYEGQRLPDGSIVAWAEHEDVVLALTIMPDGGAVLLGTHPDRDAAVTAARRAYDWQVGRGT